MWHVGSRSLTEDRSRAACIGSTAGPSGKTPNSHFISENDSLCCFPYVWKALLKQPSKIMDGKIALLVDTLAFPCLELSSSCFTKRSGALPAPPVCISGSQGGLDGRTQGLVGLVNCRRKTSQGPHSKSLTPQKPRLELRHLGGVHGGDVCGVLDSDFKPGCNTGDAGALVPG